MKLEMQARRTIYISEMTRLMVGNRKRMNIGFYAREGDMVTFKVKPKRYRKHTAKSSALLQMSGTVGLVIPNGAKPNSFVAWKLKPDAKRQRASARLIPTTVKTRGIWLLVFDWYTGRRYGTTIGQQHKFKTNYASRSATSILLSGDPPAKVMRVDDYLVNLTLSYEAKQGWHKVSEETKDDPSK